MSETGVMNGGVASAYFLYFLYQSILAHRFLNAYETCLTYLFP